MAGKIFYRERVKGQEGGRKPRFRIIAVCDANLKVFGDHFRKKELEQMAAAANCELIELERDPNAESRK